MGNTSVSGTGAHAAGVRHHFPHERDRKWCQTPLLILMLVAPAAADQIKLKDGGEVAGTIVQRDSESVIIQVPRAVVASVNGQPLPPPVAVGREAPQFHVDDVKGISRGVPGPKQGATLLKFWASWCPHCRSDVPLMKRLASVYKDQGLQLVTVSIDQDRKALDAFLEKEQITYPVIAMAAGPLQAVVPDLYEVQGIPAYFLIDREGKVVKKWAGSLTEGRVEIEKALAPVLAPSASSP